MRCRVTPLVVVIMAVCLVVTMLTPAARGQTTANLELTSDNSPVATSASHGSSETQDRGGTMATVTDSQSGTTSATTSPASANGAVTNDTITSIQTQLGSVVSTFTQSIVTNMLTTTAVSVVELNATELQNSTATAATEENDLHSTTSSVPWASQGAAVTKQATDNALRVNYSAASYLPSDDQFTAETDAVTFTSSIRNTDTDITEPTTREHFTHPSMISTIANGSASSAVMTAALHTVNTTESPATEAAAVQVSASVTSTLFSWATSGGTAGKLATGDAELVNYSSSRNASTWIAYEATEALASTPPVPQSSTDSTSATNGAQPAQQHEIFTMTGGSVNTTSTLLATALATANATQFPFTILSGAQEVALTTNGTPTTTSSSVTAEKLTTGDASPVNYSSSRNASTWITYEATEALPSATPVPKSSTDNTSTIKGAQHHEIFTMTGGSVNTTSTLLATTLATENATQFPFTISSGAQEFALTTNGTPSTTSSDTSSITAAAAAHSSAPYSAQTASEQTVSEQTASISEKAALVTDGASTAASVLISVETAASTTSSTRFDRLRLSTTASLHDGATTADASFNSSGATHTPPPPLFTKDGSNNTKSTAWTPGPTVGHTVVTLTVVIAAVIFAGAALIACTFIFFKCWAALRVCSMRKRHCGSYKADASYGDGRSWPRPVTSAAWRQARDVATAGANATLARSAAPMAAGTAADDRLLSLWVSSDIADEASPRHAHSSAAKNTERKLPGMLSEDRPDGQLNGVELPPLAASPLGVRWPLTTFRGVTADYRAPVTSRTPAYTALKIDVEDRNSIESGGTHSGEANQYVVLPGDTLARTML